MRAQKAKYRHSYHSSTVDFSALNSRMEKEIMFRNDNSIKFFFKCRGKCCH